LRDIHQSIAERSGKFIKSAKDMPGELRVWEPEYTRPTAEERAGPMRGPPEEPEVVHWHDEPAADVSIYTRRQRPLPAEMARFVEFSRYAERTPVAFNEGHCSAREYLRGRCGGRTLAQEEVVGLLQEWATRYGKKE
jgi:hypothetical protein